VSALRRTVESKTAAVTILRQQLAREEEKRIAGAAGVKSEDKSIQTNMGKQKVDNLIFSLTKQKIKILLL